MVLAAFSVAVFAWGFGFYGVSVYVAELHRGRGWSAGLISSATMLYYLGGALLLTRVPGWVDRLGSRRVLLGGAAVLLVGVSVVARAAAPWQMFAGFALMGLGWACTSTAAVVATLAHWFDERRGLAINLALNGASAGGFTVAPALVWLAPRCGLGLAVPGLAAAIWLLLVPLVLLASRRPRLAHASLPRPAHPPGARARALADPHFWSVALPFGLAVGVQVGLIVHLVNFMLPRIGAEGASVAVGLVSVSAVAGRLAVAGLIDRLNQRLVAAAGIALQVAGEALMLAWPASPGALYVGCVAFGLSVGNNITLPSVIIQREFPPAGFGLLVGLVTAAMQLFSATAPTLMGLAHDLSGGYRLPLAGCAVLEAAAALLLIVWRAQHKG